MREDELKIPKSAEKKLLKFIKQDITIPPSPDKSMNMSMISMTQDNYLKSKNP